jgi:CTP synthase
MRVRQRPTFHICAASAAPTKDQEATSVRVCVIGNFRPEDPGHATIASALLLAAPNGVSVDDIEWIAPETLVEDGVIDHLKDADGIVGAPGPTEAPDGYLDAIEFAREGQVPYFGCELGMDLAVVEFARTVLSIATAHSTEFDPMLRDAVIVELVAPELIKGKPIEIFGELMVKFSKEARLRDWMKADASREEHRAMFGVNSKYKTQLTRAGLKVAATDDTQLLVRAIELADHPFFVLTSFAPQLRPETAGPHPILQAFINSIVG